MANNISDLTKSFQKAYGESIGGKGHKDLDLERIPTDIFAFDLASGGGFPRGKISIVYGPESSNKTNLVLRAIAQHQKLWPKLKCVFFDVENSFNVEWAEKLGVDNDELYVLKPDYAEQTVDMIEGVLDSKDCGLVVIDSLAAMITIQETSSSAEKANVGGSGLVIGKLVRKLLHSFRKSEKEGRAPTVLLVNQIRQKVGVMYGNPETMPGGHAPVFAATMIVRVYGKDIMENSIHKTIPTFKETKMLIKKWKVPIISKEAVFKMVMVPHKGLVVGQCDDWNSISKYMNDYGLLEKGKKAGQWFIMDMNGEMIQYKTLGQCREHLYATKGLYHIVRKAIIEQAREGGLIEAQEDE